MTPIRSAHVVPSVLKESSGLSHSVPNLCRALADEAIEIELHVLEPLPQRTLVFPVTAHSTLKFPGATRLGVSPSMSRALAAAARRVEILHSHSLWMMPQVYAGRAARGALCKLVVSPRGTLEPWAWNLHRWRKALVWRLGQAQTLHSADLFHATAESECQSIRSRGFEQPIAVIPNGVTIPDVDARTPATEGTRTLLFLSRIHPTKRVDRLLHAWRQVAGEFPRWTLAIAGPLNDPYAASMQRLASDLELVRVRFLGEVTGEDKWAVYRAADLFVLPTHSENFGMAIAEALAAGIPVITTRGAPWAGLEPRRCGWWIPHGDAEMVSALRFAMSLPQAELRAMGARGKAWMLEEFSWAHSARMMAATYRWLLGRDERPGWVND